MLIFPGIKLSFLENLLAHEYFGLDLELVWGIVTENIPILKTDINRILEYLQ